MTDRARTPGTPSAAAAPAQDSEVADPSVFAAARTVLGLLLVIAGPVVLGIALLPQLLPTIGPGAFTVWGRLEFPENHGTLPLLFGALVLPAGGFSLAYKSTSHRRRRWIAGACIPLFGLQTVLLAAAVLWMTGAGYTASELLAADRDDSTAIIAAPLGLLLSLAAAAIMYALARRTDFDAKSGEYFGAAMGTVVRVKPLPVGIHALWAAAALAAWAAVVFLPALAASRVAEGGLNDNVPNDEPMAWPSLAGSDFDTARAAYAVVLGILVGAVISSLLKKVLYRTVLGGYIKRPVDAATVKRWRAVSGGAEHYPISVAGGFLTGSVLFFVPVDSYYDPDVASAVVLAAIAAVAIVAGFYLVSSIWKNGLDPLLDSPLQQTDPRAAGRLLKGSNRRRRKR
jgi:hypothetical protein